MADVFEANPVLDAERQRLWRLIGETLQLTWQLLTKRPENVRRLVPESWLTAWPEHVWIGCTVEDQTRAKIRLPRLLSIPAPLRFLSCEPLLGPVDLLEWMPDGGVHWIIVGGESGPKHRPLDPTWAVSLRHQAQANGIPFFFKQVGGQRPTSGGDLLDCERIKEFPSS